jgi:hypothetical protein
MEWLKRNPVRNTADIEFLTNEILRLEDILKRSTQGCSEVHVPVELHGCGTIGKRGHWQGSVPYLCIIMCLTWDNVKCLSFQSRY